MTLFLKYKAKLEQLEKSLLQLKKDVGIETSPTILSLKGILKNTIITQQDIEKAKKSLFKSSKI